jgi:hypothetical protein
MDFNKYVTEDLDNDLEAIFADMMDDGFEVKKRTKELHQAYLITYILGPLVDVIMTRRTGTGFLFDIMPYKEHIKQLFNILERKGIQFFYGLVYLEGKSVMVNEVDSILLYNDPDFTDFRGKTWEEIWDALTFTIYCSSEQDSITNFTMTFCEK